MTESEMGEAGTTNEILSGAAADIEQLREEKGGGAKMSGEKKSLIVNGVDLYKFCTVKDAYPSKYELENPFRDGEFICATDGRIMIRVKSDAKVNEGGKKQPMYEMKSILSEITGELKPWPYLPVVTNLVECEECKGSGKALVECPECYGDGYCRHCGDGKCGECKGDGVVKSTSGTQCKDCNGSGKVPHYQESDLIDGHVFNGRVHEQLNSLPNMRYCWKDSSTIRFVFDGGEGAAATCKT